MVKNGATIFLLVSFWIMASSDDDDDFMSRLEANTPFQSVSTVLAAARVAGLSDVIESASTNSSSSKNDALKGGAGGVIARNSEEAGDEDNTGYRYQGRRHSDDADAKKKGKVGSRKRARVSSSGPDDGEGGEEGDGGTRNGIGWTAEEILGLCKLVDACGGRLPLPEMGPADEGLAEYLVPTRTAVSCSAKLADFGQTYGTRGGGGGEERRGVMAFYAALQSSAS